MAAIPSGVESTHRVQAVTAAGAVTFTDYEALTTREARADHLAAEATDQVHAVWRIEGRDVPNWAAES